MKIKLIFLLLLLGFNVLAQPGWRSFTTNQFSTNGLQLKIKSGALFTNVQLRGVTSVVTQNVGTIFITNNPFIFNTNGSFVGTLTGNAGTVTASNIWDKFNVKLWGAVGDTNTDDTAAIQAAIDSLPPLVGIDYGNQLITNGGVIRMPKGTYKITSPIRLKSHQQLIGDGPGTIILNTATNTAAIEIGDGTNAVYRARVSHLSIRGPSVVGSGSYGIWARFFYRSDIEDVWITGAGDTAIFIDGSSYSYVRDCRLYGNYGHGIYFLASDGPHYVTASWVQGCTILSSTKSGVVLEGAVGCFINDNTIESNGIVGEQVGFETAFGGWRSINLHLKGAVGVTVAENYFEQSSVGGGYYTNPTQIALSGGYFNAFKNNYLANQCGVYLYSSADAVPSYNMFRDNLFPLTLSNMITARYTSDEAPSNNWFVDNIGMNWFDQDTNYTANTVTTPASGDGLNYSVITLSPTNSFVPDGGVIRSTNVDAGQRFGRIYDLTLTNNLSIGLPVDFTYGDQLTFLFSQSSPGNYTVTWDAAFKQTWQNIVTASATARSSVRFIRAGDYFVQIGDQQPWTLGGGTPGGANTQVQFNDLGVLGGDPLFTYNKTSDTLTASNGIFNGTVGVGTVPARPLHVMSEDFPQLRIGYNAGNYVDISHGGVFDVYSGGANDIRFKADGSLSVTIKSDGTGFVGIGTNAPSAKLHVIGDAIITGAQTNTALAGSGYRFLQVDDGGKFSAVMATNLSGVGLSTFNTTQFSAGAGGTNIKSGATLTNTMFSRASTNDPALILFGNGVGFVGDLLVVSNNVNGIVASIQAQGLFDGLGYVSEAGTVGEPSYSFTGDPDTGIYSSAADNLSFATAGANRMQINSAGSVFVAGLTISSNGFAGFRSNSIAPATFTFPATTVNWTNPLTCSIQVYIDNFGVTGSALKKNGGTIASGITQFISLGLQPGEYFSQTYTVGTPTATFSPFP